MHGHRHRACSRGAIAQLSIVVQPPGDQRAIRAESQVVISACCDRDHRPACQRRAKRAHSDWLEAVGGAVIAEFTMGIATPGRECAVSAEGEAVSCAGGQCRHGPACEHTSCHCRCWQEAIQNAVVTDLACIVFTPAQQAASSPARLGRAN